VNGAAGPELLGRGQVEGLRTEPRFECEDAHGDVVGEHAWSEPIRHAVAIDYVIDWIQANVTNARIDAAGHRAVFGGPTVTGPIVVDDGVLANLETLVPFFPLHLPHNIAAIRALAEGRPDLPQAACFDNSFHRTQPRVAQLFALPRALFEQGVRRYGFHGLSYEYIATKIPAYVPDASRVVVAHPGSGASMCAILNGESVESTLSFSGLDGLPMGTRTGSLDPGVLLYFMQALGMDAAAIQRPVYTQSGLLGVSGVSDDMRDLLNSEGPYAAEAVDLFVYHIAKQLGALTAVLEGLDALVFTAGIGERSAEIRRRVCRRAQWFGIELDRAANAAAGPRISTPGSPVSVWVIPTDEERMIAIHTANVLTLGA
jgi:acetate kinase